MFPRSPHALGGLLSRALYNHARCTISSAMNPEMRAPPSGNKRSALLANMSRVLVGILLRTHCPVHFRVHCARNVPRCGQKECDVPRGNAFDQRIPMPYTTVIFDLDGTLLNTLDDLAAAGNHVCAAHGWPTFTPDQYRYKVGNGQPKLIERIIPAEYAGDGRMFEQVIGEFRAYYDAHQGGSHSPLPRCDGATRPPARRGRETRRALQQRPCRRGTTR